MILAKQKGFLFQKDSMKLCFICKAYLNHQQVQMNHSNHWYNVLLSPCHCWLVFTNELTEIEEPSNSQLATQGGLCAGACMSLCLLIERRVLSSHVATQFTSLQSCWCHWHQDWGPKPPGARGGVAGAPVAGRGQPSKSAALRTVSLIPQQEHGSWSGLSVQPGNDITCTGSDVWPHYQSLIVLLTEFQFFFSLSSFCFWQLSKIISVILWMLD